MFFTFDQNNSGGVFDVDDNVDKHVIIEARTAKLANAIAETIGIYFDGCDYGIDCNCCGDRWSPVWGDKGDDTPLIYGKPPKSNYRIHYLDGRIERG